MKEKRSQRQELQEYYGRVIRTSRDLKTNACCCDEDAFPPSIRKIVAQIDKEILAKSYGCGSPIPPSLEGCTVLDLGCGSGKDAYIVSKLVGPKGYVIGIDMTEEQLEVARRFSESQAAQFGYKKSNISFPSGKAILKNFFRQESRMNLWMWSFQTASSIFPLINWARLARSSAC